MTAQLTSDEQTQLERDLLDLIEDRVADLVEASAYACTPEGAITAALVVDTALRRAAAEVSGRLDDAARDLGMTWEEIGAARGKTRQAAHSAAARRQS